MRVLVTGSAGFVGRHMVAALQARGHTVTGIDLVNGDDALDFFRTDRMRYDLAVHCAAVIGGRAGIDGSPIAVGTNLALDSWLFRWMELSGTDRAVYFSSSAVYPVELQRTGHPTVLREDHVRWDTDVIGVPDGTYGWCKLAGEDLARRANQAGMRVHVVRPFSGYGPDQSEDYPFGAFLGRAIRREDPFTVWGDGSAVRDWIHIDDIVAAVLAMVDRDIIGPVHLCTGVGTTFAELAAMFTSVAGYSPTIRYLADRPTGVAHRVGDPRRLLEFYCPRITIEHGIQSAVTAAVAAAPAP